MRKSITYVIVSMNSLVRVCEMTDFRNENKTIAIIDPDGSVSSAPTIIEIIRRFDALGYTCDVFIPQRHHLKVDLKARLFVCPRLFPIAFCFGRDFLRSCRDWLVGLRSFRNRPSGYYRIAFGINPEGIVLASKKFRCEDLVYLSFELFSENDTNSPVFLRLKLLERQASQLASLVISQDSIREGFLREDLELHETPFVNFPVAPAGLPAINNRTGCNQENIKVVISGSFSAFTRTETILDSVPSWSPEFSLTVNSNASYSDKIIARHCSERIRFNQGNLPESDYVKLLDSMDIGIVGYSPIHGKNPFLMTNIELMGLSSGKLAFYARSGLPMVLIGYPFPPDLFGKYSFCISIDDESQLAGALQELVENYSDFSRESRRLFDEVLNFDVHLPKLFGQLKLN
jgi:glycosyltransferase involved in cell wall biosynthesis